MRQGSFFEDPRVYARLDAAGDPLQKLDTFVDWSGLSPLLEPLRFESGAKGGRPGLDPLMMVKCLILQSLYNISDEACEYQINDRLSFKRFLGLPAGAKAPDAKTIWLYRERIKHSGLHEKIFAWFAGCLEAAGYAAKEGQMVDASFVPVHKPTGKHAKQLQEEIPLTEAQNRQIGLSTVKRTV